MTILDKSLPIAIFSRLASTQSYI